MKKDRIPKDDRKDIDKVMSHNRSADTINKDGGGGVIDSKKELVNPQGYVLRNYRGRVLKQNKSWIPKGGTQRLVGKKGQKFEDIPSEISKHILWSESDFESE